MKYSKLYFHQLRIQVSLQRKNKNIHRHVLGINTDDFCGGTEADGSEEGLVGTPNHVFSIFLTKSSEASWHSIGYDEIGDGY